LSNHSATNLCMKTALDLRDHYSIFSCELIQICKKNPMVPSLPNLCSMVLAVLCGLVLVLSSTDFQTVVGRSSCSFGKSSAMYRSHPTSG
jgi:hypothetical protein